MPVPSPDDPNEWFSDADLVLTLWPSKVRGQLGEERGGPGLLTLVGYWGQSCAAFNCIRDICETGQV